MSSGKDWQPLCAERNIAYSLQHQNKSRVLLQTGLRVRRDDSAYAWGPIPKTARKSWNADARLPYTKAWIAARGELMAQLLAATGRAAHAGAQAPPKEDVHSRVLAPCTGEVAGPICNRSLASKYYVAEGACDLTSRWPFRRAHMQAAIFGSELFRCDA